MIERHKLRLRWFRSGERNERYRLNKAQRNEEQMNIKQKLRNSTTE